MAKSQTLSDESKRAISEAEAEENSGAIEAEFAAVSSADDPFSPENLASPLAMPASLAQRSQPTKGGRSPAQAALDKVVESVHTRWIDAGKPRTWPDLVAAGVVAGYWLEPHAAEKMKKMLTSGGNLLNYRIRYGTYANRSDDMEQDGKVFLSFSVLDRRPRTSSTNATETA